MSTKFLYSFIAMECSSFNYFYIKNFDLYAFLAELIHTILENRVFQASSSWSINSTVRWSWYELIYFFPDAPLLLPRLTGHPVRTYASFRYLSPKGPLTTFSPYERNESARYCWPRRDWAGELLIRCWGAPISKPTASRIRPEGFDATTARH